MSEKDFAIGTVAAPLPGSTISKKPSYLVTLEDGSGKSKSTLRFMAVDRPDLLNGFISVKGFFTEASEEEVVTKFATILASTPKDQLMEMLFPWHRITSIRSLVFNAVKPTIVNK
jgi:hypothetical protein